MIVNSYQQNIQFTSTGPVIPVGDFSVCTIQVDPSSAAWATAVMTVKRGNRQDGPFYALETATTITNPGAITSAIDVSGFEFLRVDVTTGEGGGSDEFVQVTICAKALN